MTTRREALSTAIDLSETDPPEESFVEPASSVRQNLSGGPTMWQARLVLSTLDQNTEWAQRLRSAIRQGNAAVADGLLDQIYARNTSRSEPAPRASYLSENSTTLLPPSPSRKKTG